jgi:hypothetical protein
VLALLPGVFWIDFGLDIVNLIFFRVLYRPVLFPLEWFISNSRSVLAAGCKRHHIYLKSSINHDTDWSSIAMAWCVVCISAFGGQSRS